MSILEKEIFLFWRLHSVFFHSFTFSDKTLQNLLLELGNLFKLKIID